jgi:hypothetical protein
MKVYLTEKDLVKTPYDDDEDQSLDVLVETTLTSECYERFYNTIWNKVSTVLRHSVIESLLYCVNSRSPSPIISNHREIVNNRDPINIYVHLVLWREL